MPLAYYNENDPGAAAWLRALVSEGCTPGGFVDERSIEDVQPNELEGYTQCHFFAGIGGWPLALRLAGWPDDRPVWTGSPPCQPFSGAGRRGGYDDARHLAPKWLDLVSQCRPSVLFGEQVAAAASNRKHAWLDDLQDELEAQGYATGAVVLPACGVGAPHIRQRIVFVAERGGHGNDERPQGWAGVPERASQCATRPASMAGRVANTERDGGRGSGSGAAGETQGGVQGEVGERERLWPDHRPGGPAVDGDGATRPPDNHWRAADWLYCRDEKWRPVEPGAQPLADGVPARVGRLRGYGNAIVPQVAAEVIRAYLGTEWLR